jgi:hypothetical protein
MAERIQESREQGPDNREALDKAGRELKAELERELNERSKETAPEQNLEQLKDKAERAAELEKKQTVETAPVEKKRDTPKQRKAKAAVSYKKTMQETQAQMSAPSRSFSKVIHNKGVEKTSELVGSTIARPNAMLAGSVSAFLLTLAIYLFARHYGYPLSGFETIAAFVLGWAVGLLFDYLRIMITGKKI